jgi:hypothetical protein
MKLVKLHGRIYENGLKYKPNYGKCEPMPLRVNL